MLSVLLVGFEYIVLENLVESGGSARFWHIEATRDGISKNRGACSESKKTLDQTVVIDIVLETLFGNIVCQNFMPSLINDDVDKVVVKYDMINSVVAFQCQEIVNFMFNFFIFFFVFVFFLSF